MIVFDFGSEKKQSTYADYLKTPEGGIFQLIGGEIIEMTSPSLYHQEILLNIVSEFRNFLLKNKIGKVFIAPSDVYFTEIETYQPDILILLTESFSKMKENKIEGAPDLIVEILSPSTAYYDLKHKKSIYEKYGVKEYWIVDPIEKTVEIFQNQNAKFHLIVELTKTDTAKSPLLAGMTIELEKIF
ncbi:MAG: Uma2 family endonuclease [Leptospiraceae bacterium]|nr:Uma2 family endonuclease [Leptospiraceae bacterium]MCP5493922.1 Uma2 family endonuclease [Leptospiraceae bacterium]